MSTLYHDLGLNEGASHEQVKSAFRRLARRFHPDVNAGNVGAEQRFKEVSRAYETLADPNAREEYDRALVCRATEVRQQRWNFAATAGVTFALTIGIIGLALWWMRTSEPDRRAPETAGRSQVVGAHEPTQASGDAKAATATLATTALPEVRARGSGWVAYHNASFKFSLKYPADVFAYDVGVARECAHLRLARRRGRAEHLHRRQLWPAPALPAIAARAWRSTMPAPPSSKARSASTGSCSAARGATGPSTSA